MTNIRSFQDVNRILSGFMSEAKSPGHAYTLERMHEIMSFLGSPQDRYRVVHIAGTSGKTSTAYYMAAMLQAAGKKVGLTVSPHVDQVNERVQINSNPLSEDKYCQEFSAFLQKIEDSGIRPTYFEFLVAFAFWLFAKEEVDYAVVEVGLGGLLDGTNVITRGDKVCIITDIGYDHVEVLGRTLPEITAQKAGIIRPYNSVFTYTQGEEVMEVLREVCEQAEAELNEITPLKGSELPKSLPLFQRRNWYLALSTYRGMADKHELPELSKAQLAKTSAVYIPARMEVVSHKGKTVILDGAHNAQKLETLAKSIKRQFTGKEIAGLVSFVNTKQANAEANLEVLSKLCSHLILTSFATEQQERYSIAPVKLVDLLESMRFENWETEADPVEAFKKLLKRPEEVLVVTGSFFLLNHIRPLILKK